MNDEWYDDEPNSWTGSRLAAEVAQMGQVWQEELPLEKRLEIIDALEREEEPS